MPTVISRPWDPCVATVTLGWIYVEKKYLWSTVGPRSDHTSLGGRIYVEKKYLRATVWILAGVTVWVQHASFTALPPGVSEDVMACAHIGGQPNLHLILPCIQELGVVPFLRF